MPREKKIDDQKWYNSFNSYIPLEKQRNWCKTRCMHGQVSLVSASYVNLKTYTTELSQGLQKS